MVIRNISIRVILNVLLKYVYDAKNSKQIRETLKDLVDYRIVGEGV